MAPFSLVNLCEKFREVKSLKKHKNGTKLVLNSFYTEKLKGSSTVHTIHVVQFMTTDHKKSVTATDCFLSVVPTKGDATSLQHSLQQFIESFHPKLKEGIFYYKKYNIGLE